MLVRPRTFKDYSKALAYRRPTHQQPGGISYKILLLHKTRRKTSLGSTAGTRAKPLFSKNVRSLSGSRKSREAPYFTGEVEGTFHTPRHRLVFRYRRGRSYGVTERARLASLRSDRSSSAAFRYNGRRQHSVPFKALRNASTRNGHRRAAAKNPFTYRHYFPGTATNSLDGCAAFTRYNPTGFTHNGWSITSLVLVKSFTYYVRFGGFMAHFTEYSLLTTPYRIDLNFEDLSVSGRVQCGLVKSTLHAPLPTIYTGGFVVHLLYRIDVHFRSCKGGLNIGSITHPELLTYHSLEQDNVHNIFCTKTKYRYYSNLANLRGSSLLLNLYYDLSCFVRKNSRYNYCDNPLTTNLRTTYPSVGAVFKPRNFPRGFRSTWPVESAEVRVTDLHGRLYTRVRRLAFLRFSKKSTYRRRRRLFSRKLSNLKYRSYLKPRFVDKYTSHLRSYFARVPHNFSAGRFKRLLRLARPLKSLKSRTAPAVYKRPSLARKHLSLVKLTHSPSLPVLLRTPKVNLIDTLSLDTLQVFIKNPLTLTYLLNLHTFMDNKHMFNLYRGYVGGLVKPTQTNLVPNSLLKLSSSVRLSSSTTASKHTPQLTPWYYNSIIRFVENVSGKKAMFQFYTFMAREVSQEYMALYRT